MFKVLILSLALVAATTAYPGHIFADTYTTAAVLQPVHAVAKVGEIVHSVPSSVSHQSQTVVHGQTHVVSDVIAPVVTKVSTVVAAAPATVEVRSFAATPFAVLPPSEISYHGAPLLKSIAAASALTSSYVAAPLAVYH